MYAKICPSFAKDRVKVVAHGDKILRALEEGHRYKIKLKNEPVFTAVLANHWTDGHVCAQFSIDDSDDCIELMAHHYIDYIEHIGEAEEALEYVKDMVLRACRKYSRPFDRFDMRIECSLHYCGNVVFDKAIDALIAEGKIVDGGLNHRGEQAYVLAE